MSVFLSKRAKSCACSGAVGLWQIHHAARHCGDRAADPGTIMQMARCCRMRDVHLPPEARGVGLIFQDFALFPHLSRWGRTSRSA
jgi:ABC-type molybdate transport system ATPase subunit